jgi:SSS family solute:Na+ symporter
MYAAVPALLLNLAVAALLTLVLRPPGFAPGVDQTDASAYIG